MASENETVAEVREDVHEYLTSIGPGEYPDETQFEEFADRFVAAHNREVAELRRGIVELTKYMTSGASLWKERTVKSKETVVKEINND